MDLRLDEYANLGSPLHRWEPRCKLAGLVALMFAFSSVRELRLLPAMALVVGTIYALSRLPLTFLLARLRLPGFFFLMVGVLLPFLSGQTVLFRLGPLALREEGCLDLLLIAVKFVSILTTGLVLFGTTPFVTSIKAMRALGLPPILADMTLLSYRYIHEIGGDLEAMEVAMRLRGFRGRRPRGLGVLASLAGSILVRSYERADRVYRAMILRGYDGPNRPSEDFQTRPGDWAGLLAALLVAIGFVIVARWQAIE